MELPGPLVVVVVVVVDWEPDSFPEGELPEPLDVPIESNVFCMSLVTALLMESDRLWACATCTSDMMRMGIKKKPTFIESFVYQTIKGWGPRTIGVLDISSK